MILIRTNRRPPKGAVCVIRTKLGSAVAQAPTARVFLRAWSPAHLHSLPGRGFALAVTSEQSEEHRSWVCGSKVWDSGNGSWVGEFRCRLASIRSNMLTLPLVHVHNFHTCPLRPTRRVCHKGFSRVVLPKLHNGTLEVCGTAHRLPEGALVSRKSTGCVW